MGMTCGCGAPAAHGGPTDSTRHALWLRGQDEILPPVTRPDETASPGWRDLNPLQKVASLLALALALAIVIPLLWWAARWVAWLWKVAF
jgi:hypothetical protein